MTSKQESRRNSDENNGEIPKAAFIEDIEIFMMQEENGGNAELVITRLDKEYVKYKFIEMNLSKKKKAIKKQIPDIIASLHMIELLKSKKEKEETTDTLVTICDNLYLKAIVPPTDKIVLGLGANIMLEYELEEAEKLLHKNMKVAIIALSKIRKDLKFLREQLTTIEVNMARVYNWDVKKHK